MMPEISALPLAAPATAGAHRPDVGAQYGNDPFLNGQLDDVRLYSRALSAAEIRTLAS